MSTIFRWLPIAAPLAVLLFACPGPAAAQAIADPPASSSKQGSAAKDSATKTTPIGLAGGALTVSAPAEWRRVKPRNRIIEVELSVTSKPAAGAGDGPSGKASDPNGSAKKGSAAKGSATKEGTARLTILTAGGSLEDNIARWKTQFKRGAGDQLEAKIEKREVSGMALHTFDQSGTFLQSMRGPFGPKTPKPGYRMLAGMLQTKEHGNYFFKLIGPADVVGANAAGFAKMLDSVKVNR